MGSYRRDTGITSGRRSIDQKSFVTKILQIGENSLIEVETGTTGYHDTGAKTYIHIKNISNTHIELEGFGKKGNGGFKVIFRGDSELENIIEALKFITESLEKRINK